MIPLTKLFTTFCKITQKITNFAPTKPQNSTKKLQNHYTHASHLPSPIHYLPNTHSLTKTNHKVGLNPFGFTKSKYKEIGA